jgi:hypothetical protein
MSDGLCNSFGPASQFGATMFLFLSSTSSNFFPYMYVNHLNLFSFRLCTTHATTKVFYWFRRVLNFLYKLWNLNRVISVMKI